MSKAKEAAPKTETPKHEAPKWAEPENFAGFVKDVVGKIGSKAGKAEVLAKVKELHGDEASKWTGEKSGLSVAINNANKHHGYAEDTAPTTRTTKVSNNASTTDVVSCVITLQGMLKDSDYDTVKATIQEVAALLEKIGKQETLKLLDALSGRNQA